MRAQTGPVIAIPGKVGVPVTINGIVVDGAVIYGDWGLARPGHGELIVEGLVVSDWAMNERHGLSFRASKVEAQKAGAA